MINQISIDNFATIEHLSFDPGEHLNIITGETGAGKSVLVEAISTALGGRADISMVRTGAPKAVIQIAGTVEDEDVIITRELLASGKSISKINGEMVSLTKLRAFCRKFVDIHGQYDNQVMLDPQNHLSIADSYSGAALTEDLECLQARYCEYATKKKAYSDLRSEEADALKQQNYYRFESDYIHNLDLHSGEDDAIREQLDFMKNSERIYNAVNTAYELLQEEDTSVLTNLRLAADALNDISSISSDLGSVASTMDEAYYNLEDASDTLRDMRSTLDFSDEDIDRASERLSSIEDAKRKYRMSIDEIIAYGEDLDQKLNIIENFDAEIEQRKKEMNLAYQQLEEQADVVSAKRRKSADQLSAAVVRELKDLNFANSEFEVRMNRLPEIGPSGYDSMEFMISTNPGEPLRPLARIASGGEVSRIMLAFKHIIGDSDRVDTMIFDEIDTGISGRTAVVVGKKMWEIAAHHQVICITHLPQIAAYGSDNFQIVKNLSDTATQTTIHHLDEDDKRHMLAGMISGDPDSDSALRAAQELMDAAGHSSNS